MIGWSTVAPGLKALFSDMALAEAVSPEFLAQWAEGAKETTHPEVGMDLTLKITSVVGDGLDELRYTYEDDVQSETVVGHRRFTLQCRVESHFHGEADAETGWCWTMTERLRTSIRRSRNRETLDSLNVALVDIGPAVDASFSFDKRRANAAVCDFFFYTAVSDVDPVPIGWIERIDLTSLIKGVDGDTLPSPPNITNELIPAEE